MARFKKILIANRGEIAVRVNRAAHELGIETVAIFSDADRASLHVRYADEAYCVGPGPVARSYLNIPNIISAALISGADAVHPGYGFLAENARFAEICADHGWLSSARARPSSSRWATKRRPRRSCSRAAFRPRRAATFWARRPRRSRRKELGYPVMLKAVAGGGGKGMRAVNSAAELEHAFATAQAEAEANFKDGRLYMEKLILRPRHLEVQILGDTFGTIVHVGERDCSVQKPSHQKLVEEPGARTARAGVRERLHEIAVTAARTVGYTSAGTLEFLLAGEDVYFMEMNTRIQVEHPVTEMLYGVDLVGAQIASPRAGRSGSRKATVPRGHAIECRINAEESDANFAPAAGTLTDVALPGGFGVRVDSHVYAGLMIPPYYDSLLAKVVAHAATREGAIARMDTALSETKIGGIHTTTDMCRRIMNDERFREGGVAIDFLPSLLAAGAPAGS